jgi:hypothetical protein
VRACQARRPILFASFLVVQSGFEFRFSGSRVSLVSRVGASTSGFSLWVPLRWRLCNFLWVGHFEIWACFEMEKSFIVESKIFVFSVLDGASRLRVGEKRKSFSSEIVISSQCSE